MTKEETVKKLAVVSQLPTQAIREGDVDGTSYEFVTIEEALTECLEAIREIKKKL